MDQKRFLIEKVRWSGRGDKIKILANVKYFFVTDAAGSRVFNYSDDLQLDSKAVSGIYSNVMKRDYSTSGYKGRYVGMHYWVGV